MRWHVCLNYFGSSAVRVSDLFNQFQSFELLKVARECFVVFMHVVTEYPDAEILDLGFWNWSWRLGEIQNEISPSSGCFRVA
jgi:hypothetical protein